MRMDPQNHTMPSKISENLHECKDCEESWLQKPQFVPEVAEEALT